MRFCVTNEDVEGQSLSRAGNHTVLFLRHFTLVGCWRLVMIFPCCICICWCNWMVFMGMLTDPIQSQYLEHSSLFVPPPTIPIQ